jgi:hypothetical protein
LAEEQGEHTGYFSEIRVNHLSFVLPVCVCSWEHIHVVDAVILEGWILTTSHITGSTDRSVVTVFHIKTGRFGVFSALAGIVLPHGHFALLTAPGSNSDVSSEQSQSFVVLEFDKLEWPTDRTACKLWNVHDATAAIKWTAVCPPVGAVAGTTAVRTALPHGYLTAYGDYVFRFPTSLQGQVTLFQLQTGVVLLSAPLVSTLAAGVVDEASDPVIVSACLDTFSGAQPVVVLLTIDGVLHRVELSKLVKKVPKK